MTIFRGQSTFKVLNIMRSRIEKIGLIGLGLVAGVLVSMHFAAVAEKDSITSLPIEELRSFAEVAFQ